jgi:hypothetical protein
MMRVYAVIVGRSYSDARIQLFKDREEAVLVGEEQCLSLEDFHKTEMEEINIESQNVIRAWDMYINGHCTCEVWVQWLEVK